MGTAVGEQSEQHLGWNSAGPTPRELEVFEAYCRADSAVQAAAELGITAGTLRRHIHRLLAKTDCITARQLAYRLWAPK